MLNLILPVFDSELTLAEGYSDTFSMQHILMVMITEREEKNKRNIRRKGRKQREENKRKEKQRDVLQVS